MHKASEGNMFYVYAPYYMDHYCHKGHGAPIPPTVMLARLIYSMVYKTLRSSYTCLPSEQL